MRLFHFGVGFSLALGMSLGIGAGCAAGGNDNPSGTGGNVSTSNTGTGGGVGGGLITTSSGGGDAGTPDGFGACAKFNAEAKQAPAAMLIVLDRSASMSTNNKWGVAGQAIIKAIDQDVFDTMSLGFTAFPAGETAAPACLAGIYDKVYCSFYKATDAEFPVPIAPAGTDKSTASTGVRSNIFAWLNQHSPETADMSDSSPIYDALAAAYDAVRATTIEKRIVALVTDGGFSCTSVSSPKRPGYSDGLCEDWEYPSSVNKLISDARVDPTAPVNTFVVGVPGSNSHANDFPFPYAVAPYTMRLALSTYAVSGSPDTVDPTCDKSAIFSQGASDPAKPCHIDLSNNANFNPDALANAIATIRGKALGCAYDLPEPPPGESIDPSQVNVVVTVDGKDYTIPKRKDPNDMCAVDPCWDYDANGKVELIGITCSTVSTSATAKVEIYVGCATILK
ncbi:Hypothetical protein A7982_07177 [Minicystis rosea]|nr:Hypothetical protein A7982_07177 [Minicystis rosea]